MRRQSFTAVISAALLVAASLVSVAGSAASRGAPPTGNQAPVQGRPLSQPAALKLPPSAGALPAPVWPGAAHAVVKMGAHIGVVTLDRADASTPDSVDVQVVGEKGVGVRLARADTSAAPAQALVRIDYSRFAGAYGGGYAARLRMVSYPACVLTTPAVATCRTGHRLNATNDSVTRTISGVAPVDAGAVVMLESGSSSTGGDFRATNLSPTGAWSVSTGSGDFTYSVPITVPPPPVGEAPPLSLDYDSQSVDGLVSATNNQANPAGLGWSLSSAFIERHYRLCSDDGGASTVGDLCWDSPYTGTASGHEADADYTIVLNGVSGELVKDPNDSTIYHLPNDPGWRIQHLTGLTANGDNDGEFWVVTTPDGTHYWFGYGARFTDHAATNSVDTAPVFGNNPSEPCYTTGTLSPCTQAYRWNLDLVQDPNEVDTSYIYVQNTNNYYSTMGAHVERGYIYESHLREIDYGYSQGISGSNFTNAVVFDHALRCTDAMAQADPLHASMAACPSMSTSPTHYPDVPADLACGAGDPNLCADKSSGPVFFSETMLTIIHTYTISASGTWTQVMEYALKHSLHDPAGAVTPFLQLDYVQREGFAGTGSAITMPTIVFGYTDMDNTLSGSTNLQFGRMTHITTDLGGQISVTYGTPDACVSGSEPNPAFNTKDCYKHQYTPQGGTQTWAWYKKELVTQVQVDPGVGFGSGHDGDPIQTTTYSYTANKAAWRFPADPTQKRDNESWTEWRGYQKATVTTGSGSAKHSTVYYLYQGIDGDRNVVDADPNNPANWKSVSVTDGNGTSYTDLSYLPDRVLEEVDQDSAGVDQTHMFHSYWAYDIGPYAGIPDGRFIRESQTTTRTKLSTSTTSDSTWREHIVQTNFDTGQTATTKFGLPVSTSDLGQTGGAADETCTTYAYAIDMNPVSQSTLGQDEWYALNEDTKHYSAACPASAGTQDGETITYYDGATSLAANVPTGGNATRTITSVSSAQAITTSATYDGAGRVTTATDGNGNVSTTSYSPASNWPTNGITLTTPAPDPSGTTGSATGLASTTKSSPYNGQPTSVTDPNGSTTTAQYDTVGRLIKVWHPTEPTTGNASVVYTYTIPNGTSGTIPNVVNGPAKLQTQTLQSLPSTYLNAYSYVDGLGRTREAQTPAPDGSAGRDVVSTRYDDAGNTVVTSAPYYSTGTAGSGMVNPSLPALPSATQLTVDWAGRTTDSRLMALGIAQSRAHVVTAYPGDDRSTVTDANGKVTDTYTDVFGRMSSVVQPTTITTTYTYTDTGKLATVTDAAGHQWVYLYNWLGQQTSATDPDTGTTTQTFDNNGNVVTSTDNKGQLVTNVYDAINRVTARWNGAVNANKMLNFFYDTAPGGKGQLASSTSWNNGGSAYITATDGYDADGRATGTKVTIPAIEPTLAGTYDTTYGYDAAGHRTTITYPAVGTGANALASETVTTAYTSVGTPSTVSSPLGTYVSATTFANYGPLTARTFGSGTLTATRGYTWSQALGDLTGITTSTTNNGTNTTLQNDTYTRDNAGNLAEIASTSDGQQQCFAYDNLNRLSAAFTTTTASQTSCQGATPNHSGGPSPYDLAYTYDQLGDIVSAADNIAAITNTYQYNDSTHLHAVTDLLLNGGPAGHYTYSYNQNGAQTGRTVAGGVFSASTWTVQHQLSTFTTGTAVTSFYYDASGARLMRKSPTDVALYLPGQELHLSGTVVTPTRYYSEGDSQVAMRVGGGALSWTTGDTQGSAQLTINAATLTPTRQRYLPFGAQRGTQGPAAGTDKSFLGRPLDPTSGLIADGARYYDTTTGRFTSPDPVTTPGNPQNLNAYSYSVNNPESLSDPSGLIYCDDNGDCATGPLPAGGLSAGQPHRPPAPQKHGGTGTTYHNPGPGVPPPPPTPRNKVFGTEKEVNRSAKGPAEPPKPRIAYCHAGKICIIPTDTQAVVCTTLNYRDGNKFCLFDSPDKNGYLTNSPTIVDTHGQTLVSGSTYDGGFWGAAAGELIGIGVCMAVTEGGCAPLAAAAAGVAGADTGAQIGSLADSSDPLDNYAKTPGQQTYLNYDPFAIRWIFGIQIKAGSYGEYDQIPGSWYVHDQ